jgi:hypothetical protein
MPCYGALTVTVNAPLRENDLTEAAVAWLRERLPRAWSVEASRQNADGTTAGWGGPDGTIVINAHGFLATLAVEAKRSLGPRDVAGLFGSVGQKLRALSPNVPILVVAPWLSPRTRELLSAEDVNYIDLTGNAQVRLDAPALFIVAQGADRDPTPTPRGRARVRGPKAFRLIRTLIDVKPPYGVRELADATRLAPGYVSRLLDALDDDVLVGRSKRGGVESVDIENLLRRWTENYDVFKSNDATPYLAPRGVRAPLARVAGASGIGRVAVTGSFAAARLAPVAAPALLALYVEKPTAVADGLDLIAADQGANVVLLRPFDSVVWERIVESNGVRYVAPSQAAADCLTGNGRMPAEGEALTQWLLANEADWRSEGLDEPEGGKGGAG